SLFFWVLIHDRKFSVQIKNKATAVVERSFKKHFALFIQPRIEKAAQVGERKIGSDSSDAFHHAKPGGNHGDAQGDSRKFLALLEDKIKGHQRKRDKRDAGDQEHRAKRQPR